jgi:hypothetical protein
MAVKYDDLQNFRDELSVKNNETLAEQFAKWEKEIDDTLINGWRNVAFNEVPYLTIPFSSKTPELVKMVFEAYSKAGWFVEKRTDDDSCKSYLTFKKAQPSRTYSGERD